MKPFAAFSHSGSPDPAVTDRETRNRALSRRTAAESMVLLKNENLLPLSQQTPVALLGGGAVCTIKGGTGSGDVNEREAVTIEQGLTAAGFVLTSRD